MEFLIPLVVLIFSAILHEIMHGVVADKLGDPTARLHNRLTLNPIPHIDPLYSIAMPLIMLIASHGTFAFGAAKPVPVNPIHFKEPLKDMALTALAGPLTNFTLAVIGALLLRIIFPGINILSMEQYAMINGLNAMQILLMVILAAVVTYNLMLAIFNLIPVPPLDGSRFVTALLPYDLARSYLSIERYGIFILLTLLYFPIGGFSLGNLINNLIIFAVHALGI